MIFVAPKAAAKLNKQICLCNYLAPMNQIESNHRFLQEEKVINRNLLILDVYKNSQKVTASFYLRILFLQPCPIEQHILDICVGEQLS